MTNIKQRAREMFESQFEEHGGVMPRHRDFGQTLAKDLKNFLDQIIDMAIAEERIRSALIVEEMMDDSEYWQPIAGKILGRTIIRKADITNTK